MVVHELVVLGAGGHAKVVAELARAIGWTVLGFVDDPEKHASVMGLPVGPIESFPAGAAAAVGIGNPKVRRRLMLELLERGRKVPALVHPRGFVEPSARIGSGAVIAAGAIVGVDSTVGRGAIVNTAASIDHDNRLGDFAHAAPGARLAGTVSVGEGSWIGIGSTVIQQRSIGAWTMVGAGSVVVRDLPDEVVAFGVPAVIRKRESHFGGH
jgi:sugar O-acyltransferase (sialic acid O-acetyltransferase NeuD family)